MCKKCKSSDILNQNIISKHQSSTSLISEMLRELAQKRKDQHANKHQHNESTNKATEEKSALGDTCHLGDVSQLNSPF
jgi:hypothetical protein